MRSASSSSSTGPAQSPTSSHAGSSLSRSRTWRWSSQRLWRRAVVASQPETADGSRSLRPCWRNCSQVAWITSSASHELSRNERVTRRSSGSKRVTRRWRAAGSPAAAARTTAASSASVSVSCGRMRSRSGCCSTGSNSFERWWVGSQRPLAASRRGDRRAGVGEGRKRGPSPQPSRNGSRQAGSSATDSSVTTALTIVRRPLGRRRRSGCDGWDRRSGMGGACARPLATRLRLAVSRLQTAPERRRGAARSATPRCSGPPVASATSAARRAP